MKHGTNHEINEETSEADRYLIFRLANELYGTPLLGVREVVEMQPAKPVPNTAPHFNGVINIRGQIVGVIDLRVRFGHPTQASPNMALMVFETISGPLAALVDKVEAVVKISEQSIDKSPNIHSVEKLNFLIGIASDQKRLITLIDLNKTLEAEDLKILKLKSSQS